MGGHGLALMHFTYYLLDHSPPPVQNFTRRRFSPHERTNKGECRMTKRVLVPAFSLAVALGLLVVAPYARAASLYPTSKCVSDKLKAASKKCDAVLKAWSGWDKNQDSATRDAKLGT